MSNPYPTGFQTDNPEAPATERGLFDCFGKKEGDEDVPAAGEEHKPSVMEKLHRSNSSSSSSDKKGFLEKIKDKLPGHHKDEAVISADPGLEQAHAADGHCGGVHEQQEKKGIFEKIKEKLPGGHKDVAETNKD